MKKITFSRLDLKNSILVLLAGCLTTLAFAPFQLFPLAILSIAFLQYTLEDTSPKMGFLRGWLFGIGLFGCGIYWIYISIHQYGHINPGIALILTASFICMMAVFPGLSGFYLNRYFPKGQTIRLFLAFPAIWTLLEWLRGFLFTGFPWLTLGYSQTLSPLKGYAPIAGVSGVSFAVLLSSGLVIKAIHDYRHKTYLGIWYALMCLSILWGIGTALAFISWTNPKGAPIRVSLVQGNIPEQLKWTADMVEPTLSIYTKLSKSHWDSDLMIWPESAIPDFIENQLDFLNQMDATAKKHQSTFITGIPVRLEHQEHYYNAVIAFGNGTGYYFKRRLVPFGEYIPFEKQFTSLMNALDLPFMGFIPGTQSVQPLTAGSLKILPFICYEAAFPDQVRFTDTSVNLMVTLSNDAWFGHSSAQAQHLEMASMRALETGRPMLMVSNDGPTAIINAKGQIDAIAPSHTAFVLAGRVQPTQGETPWMTRGMDPLLLMLLSLLIQAIWRTRKQNRAVKSAPVVD